ncbi:ABC transporter permease [Halanaerobium hydrogeniformans]|uniref:Inner-membrane translocator n=1 Tax=Halanaerobium hydrogeniformans TaxID=656519 RepID=E4RNW1_HALHG|nr:ribose ABC transporter permease [Halanaerobium hydrogeniformans]ADQ13651.1 inner-membrane translocator [Halanaerobium hydrogeniformans]
MITSNQSTSANNNYSKLKSFTYKYIYLVIILVFVVALTFLSPHFFSYNNFINIFRQVSVNFILGVALTYVIITAGIDLSVGSILAFAGVTAGLFLRTGGNFILAILIALLIGSICGLINGILVSKAKLAPFIATLGMMSIARGLALVVTSGNSITIDNVNYTFLGSGIIYSIPMPVIIAIIVLLISSFVLKKTWFGRYLYAIGGSHEASRLSGIKVDKLIMITYTISGFLSGLAAVVLTARLWSAPPIAGQGYELDAIAAAVIGGASLMGGKGTILGTLYGAMVIGIIRNGLNLLGVSSFLQQVVIGVIIILAVFLDKMRNKGE